LGKFLEKNKLYMGPASDLVGKAILASRLDSLKGLGKFCTRAEGRNLKLGFSTTF